MTNQTEQSTAATGREQKAREAWLATQTLADRFVNLAGEVCEQAGLDDEDGFFEPVMEWACLHILKATLVNVKRDEQQRRIAAWIRNLSL